MSFESLPENAAFEWRAIQTGDAAALHRFELACSRLDGATNLSDQASWAATLAKLAGDEPAVPDSALAVDKAGTVVAAGWITVDPGADSARAFLEGCIHPDWRGQGIGTALLSWLEARGRERLRAIPGDRPRVLHIMFWDRAEDAVALFQGHGFQFQYVEELMGVDLHEGWPDRPLPAGFTVDLWSPAKGPDFYAVYCDAFSTRTANLNSAADWAAYWASLDYPDFRPDLSFLLREGAEPAAFSVCHVYEEPDAAYVAQFGVRQAWRGRGLGAALLAESLRRYRAAGFRQGRLMVNINNPSARRVFEQAGFRTIKRLTMYRKTVEGEE